MKTIALLTVLALALLSAPAVLAAGEPKRTVEIVDFGFRPATITVARGTKVEFENEGAVAHTVSRNGGGFNSGRIAPGKTFSLRFKAAGTFRFHCRIHPDMRGKIVVQ